jgi:YD repeat-containing protein
VTVGSRAWTVNYYASATQIDTFSTVSDPYYSPACTSCVHQQFIADNLGRVTQSRMVNDPQGATMADAVYDSAGRVQSASNPYRTTGDPTYGLETPSYDGMNRTTRITHADGNFAQAFYGAAVTGGGGAASQLCASATYGLGYPVLSVDETLKKRQVWTDGLGRTIEVDEPDSGGILNVNTCYKYDLLGNLKEVNQGTQTRLYTYDGLSRITASTPAESSPATNLYYTTTGGAGCPTSAAVGRCGFPQVVLPSQHLSQHSVWAGENRTSGGNSRNAPELQPTRTGMKLDNPHLPTAGRC